MYKLISRIATNTQIIIEIKQVLSRKVSTIGKNINSKMEYLRECLSIVV